MSSLREKYDKLHQEYLTIKGDQFDEIDIENAAISYTYNTCGIEGNTITLGETETIILSDKVIEGKSLREHIEIKDSHEAFQKMFDFISEGFEMNESLAHTFHRLNTVGWLKDEWSGKYKTINNRVGGRSTPYPAKAKELYKALFEELKTIKDPLIRAIRVHLETVLIHPWQDGNGRTARLLMNYELIKAGHGHIQISKSNKDLYFKAIRDSIDSKSTKPFEDFILDTANKTYERKISYLKEKKNPRQKVKTKAWDFNHKVQVYDN